VDRVEAFARTRKWSAGATNPVTYYTWPEACRLLGVTRMVLQNRLLRGTQPQAIQLGVRKQYALWSEPFLWLVRKAIGEGKIYVRSSSLTRPKLGARLTNARHVWADQTREAEQLRRTSPLDYVLC
jgi:hypothetical protein